MTRQKTDRVSDLIRERSKEKRRRRECDRKKVGGRGREVARKEERGGERKRIQKKRDKERETLT